MESLVQNHVDHTAWGSYAALNSLAVILAFLADPGVNQFLTKTIAESPELLRKVFPNLFVFKLIILPLYPIAIIGFALLFGFQGPDIYVAAILSIVYLFIHFNGFLRANLQGNQLFSQDAWASNLDKFFLGLFILGLLSFGFITLDNFIYARLISVALTFGALVLILVRKKVWKKPKLHKPHMNMFASMSIPYAWMTILYSANERIDMVMLHSLYSSHETGVYNAAYRILDAAMMYLWIILPFFFAKLAHFDSSDEDKDKLIKNGTAITALPLIFLSGFAFFFGDKMFFMFSNSSSADIESMQLYFLILSVSLLIHGFFTIFSTYLTSNGHTRFVNSIIFWSIILNVSLNLLFIPKYGGLAAAITTLISSTFLSVSYLTYTKLYTNIRFPWGTWSKLILIGCIYFILLYIGKHLEINWAITTLLAAITGGGLSLLTKLIRVNNIFKTE
jgi:O-antigen/teichoic acid export membrane protein